MYITLIYFVIINIILFILNLTIVNLYYNDIFT